MRQPLSFLGITVMHSKFFVEVTINERIWLEVSNNSAGITDASACEHAHAS